MNQVFIFMGAPGSGKGTQAKKLSDLLGGIPQIGSGSLLRIHIKEKTKIGLQAEQLINQGKLVPDELISDMIIQRIQQDDCHNGYILDGFPRSVAQAERFQNFSSSSLLSYEVIHLNLPKEEILNRLLSRVSCSKCGVPYSKNAQLTHCSSCQAPLISRSDDNVSTIKQRIDVYFATTLPVLTFFQKLGKIKEIDALGTVEDIFTKIKNVLNLS